MVDKDKINMPNIIAFTGKKGVGKNFVAEIAKKVIEDAYDGYAGGGRVVFAAYADPMKEFLIDIVGVERAKIYGNDKDKNSPTNYRWENMPGWLQEKFGKKEGPVTIRHTMQIFGTELCREVWDQQIWVNAMKRRIETANSDWFFITDARFQNEIDSVKEMGGFVWKVDGPGRGDEATKNDAHSSESAMDSTVRIDYTVFNGLADTPETLEQKVRKGLSECFHDKIVDAVKTEVRLQDVLKNMGTPGYAGREEFGGSDFPTE